MASILSSCKLSTSLLSVILILPVLYVDITNIGKSLAVCNTCYKQIISYKAFDIFTMFASSLSKVKEIDIENFHNYNWNDVLALFNGEKLSSNPPNRRESSGDNAPISLTVRPTTRNNRANQFVTEMRSLTARDGEQPIEADSGEILRRRRD